MVITSYRDVERKKKMMDKIVNVGIVGCGGIANNRHLPALVKMKNVRIVALSDNDINRAKQTAERFHLEVECYADYRDLLGNRQVEVIHVCTPNESHAQISIDGLRAGKHVMCEKPMASTLEQARQMIYARDETGKKLTICANTRYRKDCWHLKKLCQDHEFGEIYLAKANAIRRRGVPTWGNFLDKDIQGGGPVIDIGVHSLDLTLWLLDNYEPHFVVGKTFNKLAKLGSPANPYGNWEPESFTVEDAGIGMVVMKNGAVIMLEASWAMNIRDENPGLVTACGTKAGFDMKNGVTINGEKNGLLYDHNIILNPQKIAFYEDDAGEVYDTELEMQMWIQAVIEDKAPVVLPEQMLVATQIIDAIYQSDETGKPVFF